MASTAANNPMSMRGAENTGNVAGIVLAAGKGTRMKSRHPKPAHRLLGKPLGRYSIDLMRACGIERVVVVIGHGADEVREALGDDVEYVVQETQGGTGHAVLSALPALADHTGAVAVLQADNVLLNEDDVRSLLNSFCSTDAAVAFLTAYVDHPPPYGRIIRDERGEFVEVVEAKVCTPDQLEIREINVGAYVFRAPEIFHALQNVPPNPITGEIYLLDALPGLRDNGSVVLVPSVDGESALGINDRVEMATAGAILRRRILTRLMLDGVTIEDPNSTYVDSTVRVGQDTVIKPMTFLSGNTVIGSECEIGPGVRLTNCTLGDGVSVQMAVLTDSEVGEGTKIGPFAQLRPGCKVGRKVKIGNFVELKNTVVDDRASIGHLAYIGDADVGEHTNIGAGTITCNYDGKRKHRTQIGKEAFIGTHSTLVAPVTVGDGAFTAAGTVVTQEVPEDALAIGRVRQENKMSWARRRREQG
jgi:bifunctional UDP-N-acetylglucosamine pyrophosphorylase/glucosamine-1-phosphate N-acetyltransferase